MKRWIAAICAVCMLTAGSAAFAVEGGPEVEARACLLMEKETGTVLYEENAHEQLEPASVTKVMTMLLIMEAIDQGRLSLDETVTASANAAGMGGSQVYLKEGEQMPLREMLKALAVASANDAAVALAEHLAGSEGAFVELMNRRAAELGMEDTHFVNCTGLTAEGHVTSAYDIAVMSRELIRHELIYEFTTIWMDTIRDGEFQLANTNKLIYYYEGATGLKTGFTSTALFCLSATAERDGQEYIAVVLGSPTSQQRFDSAKALLNYAFANYTTVEVHPDRALPPVNVVMGRESTVQPVLAETGKLLVEKGLADQVTTRVELCGEVEAPVEQGQKLGEMIVSVAGEERCRVDLVAQSNVDRLTFGGIFLNLFRMLAMGEK